MKKALAMAEEDLQKDPEGEWPKRAVVWVYYAYLKKAVEKDNPAEILAQIDKIKKLKLPVTEKMVYDSIAWSSGRYLFAHEYVEGEILDHLFELLRDMPFSKPGKAYTYLLKAFSRHAAQWNRFFEFTEWWGLDHFMPEDYKNFITDNGRKLPSAVESIYIAVAKHLLIPPLDKKAIQRFLPRIEKISHEYKNMQYPPYYFARLLLALGDKKKFLQAFLPFARKKKNEFWTWDLLSEAFEGNTQEHFSCLCKSLSCGAPVKFTINVKEKIAKVFEKKKRYPEAKREYLDIIEIRESEGWPLKEKHTAWTEASWWNETRPARDNFTVYHSGKELAEKLLFRDKPETLIVTVSVNKEKTVLSFIASREIYGFIYYGKLNVDPVPGDVYLVRFRDREKREKPGFFRVYTIEKTDHTPPPGLLRTVTGKAVIRPGNSFGFLDEVYLSPRMIRENGIETEKEISVMAVLSYDKKKKNWGWTGIKKI